MKSIGAVERSLFGCGTGHVTLENKIAAVLVVGTTNDHLARRYD